MLVTPANEMLCGMPTRPKATAYRARRTRWCDRAAEAQRYQQTLPWPPSLQTGPAPSSVIVQPGARIQLPQVFQHTRPIRLTTPFVPTNVDGQRLPALFRRVRAPWSRCASQPRSQTKMRPLPPSRLWVSAPATRPLFVHVLSQTGRSRRENNR